jgi:diaminopimelate epimerase
VHGGDDIPARADISMDEPIDFAKMAGGGNDFILIDNRDRIVIDPAALAEAACMRRLSVGADGLILVDRSSRADVRMVYFNRDGSRADFCANGTRCAARFAHLEGMTGPELALETDAGIIPATVTGARVTLRLEAPRDYAADFALSEGMPGSRIMVGVPHWVTFVEENLWGIDVITTGREARHHQRLQPEGANINFVTVSSPERIEVRTYERGVEDETLSCGSGVVASVCVAALERGVVSPVTVLTRSGIEYQVSFVMDGGLPRELQLSGDARLVYRGAIGQETIHGFDPRWVRNPTQAPPRT